jgi:hypothetical protein
MRLPFRRLPRSAGVGKTSFYFVQNIFHHTYACIRPVAKDLIYMYIYIYNITIYIYNITHKQTPTQDLKKKLGMTNSFPAGLLLLQYLAICTKISQI